MREEKSYLKATILRKVVSICSSDEEKWVTMNQANDNRDKVNTTIENDEYNFYPSFFFHFSYSTREYIFRLGKEDSIIVSLKKYWGTYVET